MPANKNVMTRYKILDELLNNRYHIISNMTTIDKFKDVFFGQAIDYDLDLGTEGMTTEDVIRNSYNAIPFHSYFERNLHCF